MTIKAVIPIGIGDLLYVKAMLDAVKHQHDEINIRFCREIIDSYNLDPEYNLFLDDLGNLLFSDHPYKINDITNTRPLSGLVDLCQENNIKPVKPQLKDLLCNGPGLNLDKDYIVVATKSRYLPRTHFDQLAPSLWTTLNSLSQKYTIVVLGERIVEMNKGYEEFLNEIYSTYEDIKNNVNVLDMTIPALGITSPKLNRLQQDCQIMKEAKFVVTLGVGGSFCMATSVANVIGYRCDNDPIANAVFDRDYSDAIVTKDWNRFISILENK